MNPLDKMILGAVKCVICGAAYGKCDCWAKCPKCGWTIQKGDDTHRCPRRKRDAKPKRA